MKEAFKYIFCVTSIILFQISCSDKVNKSNKNEDKVIKMTLTERPIEKTGYFISLPIDYTITTSNGPDFSVYYFSPTDTTVKDKLSGGLYFGNFPHEFEADNDSCKIETLKGKIFDNVQEWTVYNCQGDFSIQTIADNKNGEGWNQRIHAFGHTKSRDELQSILEIYSTLKKK